LLQLKPSGYANRVVNRIIRRVALKKATLHALNVEQYSAAMGVESSEE